MLSAARQCFLCLAALAALALSAPAMAEDCWNPKGKCFGVDWKTATPAETKNVNIKARDDAGLTPLHVAAQHGNIDVINALIKGGANVNDKGKNGKTPLMAAVENNTTPEVVNALVDGGADVNYKDKYGDTPLLLAARHNTSPEVINALIQGGANLNEKNIYGDTPLLLVMANNTSPEVVNPLIKGGADVNAKNEDGDTPLHWATRHNTSPEVIKALIKGGAKVNAKNKQVNVQTTRQIHDFPLFQNKIAIKITIRSGGNTPLHNAVRANNPDIVLLLIKSGADATIMNYEGKTALQVVGKKKALRAAIQALRATIVLNSGITDVNAKDISGNTPLHWAARFNTNPEIINILIQNGADVNNTNGNSGDTPLHWATKYNTNPEVVNAFIQNGANVNALGSFNNTPLHLAVQYNTNPEVINILIQNGADASIKNLVGKTALQLSGLQLSSGRSDTSVYQALKEATDKQKR